MLLAHDRWGSGRPVVLLHGMFGSAANWKTVARELASNWDVLALDLRGHGRSAAAGFTSVPNMAADVAETLAALLVSAPVIVGHSLGGKVAMEFVLREHAQAAGLVIVDIAARAYPPGNQDVVEAMLELEPANYSRRNEVVAALVAKLGNETLAHFLATNVERRDGGLVWRLDLDGLRTALPALSGHESFGRYDGPALVLRSENSDYVRDADVETLAELFPQLEVATVAGAGHWVHWEKRQVFLELLAGFLNSLDSGRPDV
ncbi:MAG: esterase [Hyphomicrobiaceae bacterium]|jgi:esterase